MKKNLIALFLGTIFILPGISHADQIFGEFKRLPDDIERGFSVGTDFGAFFLLGDSLAKRTAKSPGFQLAFTFGYDIMKYLSVEELTTMAIQEANPLDPVLKGGVNWFIFDGVIKAQYPMGRWYPFIEGGGGIIYTHPSTTVAGDNYKTDIIVGGGFEYYTYQRHYSLYVKGAYHKMDLPVDSLTISAGLKYTF